MSAAPSPAPNTRLRQKVPAMGITAGAEDAKYHAKYKELKRKVRDIEADNEKLHLKVLQAKLSIRRMKMERAILYERLSTVPCSPGIQDRQPLPPPSVPGGPGGLLPAHLQPRGGNGGNQGQPRDHPFHIELDQQGAGPPAHIHVRHHRGPTDPRMNPVIDPRPLSAPDSQQPPGSSPHMVVHSPPRRIPSTHDNSRLQQQQQPQQPYESAHSPHPHGGISHALRSSPRTAHSHPNSHQSAPSAGQTFRGGSCNPNSTPNSSGHVPVTGSQGQPQTHHAESLTPVQQALHSPPTSERDFERGRPHPHQHPYPHPHPHQHQHQHSHQVQYPHQPHHHHVIHHHHHGHPQQPQQQPLPLPLPQAPHEYEYDYPTASSAHGGDPSGAIPPTPPHMSHGSGSGRMHAHLHSRMAYEYPPPSGPVLGPTQEGKRDREREKDRDPADREWERERDRAREYSRGELINYSPHPRTRSAQTFSHSHNSQSQSQSQSQVSRPQSRTPSQSHAYGSHPAPPIPRSRSSSNVNSSGDYDPTSNSAPPRNRIGVPSTATATLTPVPQSTNPPSEGPHSTDGSSNTQGYYPVESVPRLAPTSRGTTPVHPGIGDAIHGGSRDREVMETGRKRSRNEMEVDGENVVSGSMPANGAVGGRGQDDRGGKRYHRDADASPADECR